MLRDCDSNIHQVTSCEVLGLQDNRGYIAVVLIALCSMSSIIETVRSKRKRLMVAISGLTEMSKILLTHILQWYNLKVDFNEDGGLCRK